jgi:hypothetical protein
MRDPHAFDSELAHVAKDLPVGADGRYVLDVVAEIAWGSAWTADERLTRVGFRKLCRVRAFSRPSALIDRVPSG